MDERNEGHFWRRLNLFSDCLNDFCIIHFAAMSRAVSLCSQRCTCGRLTRSLHWLEKECENVNVCGMMEIRLALNIAWVGRVGCGCGDELDALAALSSLSVCDDKSGDQKKKREDERTGIGMYCFLFAMGKGNDTFEFINECSRRNEGRTGLLFCS